MTKQNKIRFLYGFIIVVLAIFVLVKYISQDAHNRHELSRITVTGNKFLNEIMAFKKQNGRFPNDDREIRAILLDKKIASDVLEWQYDKREGEHFYVIATPKLHLESGKPFITLHYDNGKFTDWILEKLGEDTKQHLAPPSFEN